MTRRRCELFHVFSIGPDGGSYTMRFLGGGIVVLAIVALLVVRRRRAVAAAAAAGAVVLAVIWAGLYAARPAWLVAALDTPDGATTGALDWTTRAPGLDTADLPIDVNDQPVDAVALVRVDPARYQVSVHWDRSASRTAEDWQRELGAAVIVNGSYFEPDHSPSTPLQIDHELIGPPGYVSTHGALVVGDAPAIVDLRGRDVAGALAPYRDAMVSYPLLIAPDGTTRAAGHDDWLANRTFIAIDRDDRVVIGTTRTGFCSLRRLADLLLRSPLRLRVALNLDGGPLASQVVAVGAWRRSVHGNAEVTGTGDVLRAFYQDQRAAPVALPIVVAVAARD
jgi:hypothetical protein